MDYSGVADPRVYADHERLQALFRHMRANEPVAHIEAEGFRPFWAVSRHADVIEVERQHERFLNEPRPVLQLAHLEKLAEGSPFNLRTLVNMDEPDHKVFRNITQDWFMPGNLKRVETRVNAIAREFVDRMLEMDGACDFVRDVAMWYPLRVIMSILGVPERDEALMLKLTQELFGANDPDLQRKVTTDEERMQVVMDFFVYFAEMTRQRRATPMDDVASVIANARINGELMSDVEAVSYYVIIATAGHDTTSSSTAGGLLALLEHPDEMKKLREDRSLIPSTVEEAIRWVTPVKHFMRTATEDYQLRDRHIRAGESLMLLYASANRDEDVFDDPYRFRVDRRPNKHIAFGFGVHRCLGHLLAKMEMASLFNALLDRVDDIELAGKTAWVQSTFVSGLKTMPIRFKAK